MEEKLLAWTGAVNSLTWRKHEINQAQITELSARLKKATELLTEALNYLYDLQNQLNEIEVTIKKSGLTGELMLQRKIIRHDIKVVLESLHQSKLQELIPQKEQELEELK